MSGAGQSKRVCDQQDQEANAFALALLMPKEKFIAEVKKLNWDLANEHENSIGKLAKMFRVSKNAVAIRIAMLKIF